jgi:hypothetical protein
MRVIRAHFDGSAIIPDEPLSLPAQAKVIVLVDFDETSARAELDQAAREYYQSQSPEERADDLSWGRAVAPDSKHAWDGE